MGEWESTQQSAFSRLRFVQSAGHLANVQGLSAECSPRRICYRFPAAFSRCINLPRLTTARLTVPEPISCLSSRALTWKT